MQQDLVDFSSLKAISIAKLGTSSIAFQMMTYLTFNEFSNNTLTFGDKSSANFKLVVASVDWISKSISSLDRIKANANLQTTRREAAPHFNVGRLYELIVNSKDQNHSHQLVVRYKCSKISLHFCEDCRIFCEGVKDDGDVVVKQWSANNLDADKMWRHSSKSNMTLMLSVLLVIESMWQVNMEPIGKATILWNDWSYLLSWRWRQKCKWRSMFSNWQELSYWLANISFQSILISNSEGARFAPNNTAKVKAVLHSEGDQTFPTILSVKPHGPAPKLIVICN